MALRSRKSGAYIFAPQRDRYLTKLMCIFTLFIVMAVVLLDLHVELAMHLTALSHQVIVSLISLFVKGFFAVGAIILSVLS